MRVLVTGGLGVIGSEIAASYLDEGHDVVIIDSAEEKRNRWIWKRLSAKYGDRVDVYVARLERADLGGILEGVDQVVHAAASTGIPHSREQPADDWASNVDATRALLDALRIRPVPTVVLSSVKPYRTTFSQYVDDIGERQVAQMNLHGGLSEDDPLDPDEPYAASKAAQSMLATAWARSYGIPVVTLRCSNLYGPAPCHGPRHGWLTWFCISTAIGRAIEVQGGGEQARDMLYSSDVVVACRAALVSAYALRGRVFLIGGGRSNVISVRQAAMRLQELTGVEVVEGPGRQHEDQLVYVDHSAYTTATGWRPMISVSSGLLQVLAWAQQHADDLREIYRWK